MIITHPGEIAVVGVLTISLNPEISEFIELKTVRGIEHILLGDVVTAGVVTRVHCWVARDNKKIPVKSITAVITIGRYPSCDLPVLIVYSMVDCVHRLILTLLTSIFVICKAHYASVLRGLAATHSGRSIVVAPSLSAASRAKSSVSAVPMLAFSS